MLLLFAGQLLIEAQLALTVFAAFFLRIGNQFGLVAVTRLAVAAGITPLLTLHLHDHLALLASGLCPLALQGRLERLLFLLARCRIMTVVAAIHRQPEGRQLDNFVDLVQQTAIVADQDQAIGPALDLLRELVLLIDIQMVARLIQNQPVGPR
ncbi:hypothetical protein D3C84_651160 [compost metagenome]